jgi:hypothetical protein
MYTTRVQWETLRVLTAPFSGAYQAVGSPLANPSYKLKLVNNTTALVTISIDGVNDIDVAPAGSFWLYDEYSTQFREGIPANTQIYVKGAVGTGGANNVYLVTQFLQQL